MSNSTLMRDAEDLYEALNKLIRAHQFRDRGNICCYDVSVSQCYALETLVKRGPLRLQSLAEEMYLDKSTASRVVNALERKGYVTRVNDQKDRRAIQVQSTASGRALYHRIRSDLIEEECELIKNLTPEVRQASLTLLRQLARSAELRCNLQADSLSSEGADAAQS